MTEHSKPRVGLVAESDLHRHLLAGLLDAGGYDLALSMNTDRLVSKLEQEGSATLEQQLDVWLLDLETLDIQRVLNLLVEYSDLPLLVNDEIPNVQDATAHQYWQRRLLEKLEVVAVRGSNEDGTAADNPAAHSLETSDRVWVLVASYGGPEAVKTFLSALPAGLPLTMVYGQHIETNFDQVLTSAVGASHNYPIRLLRGRSQLAAAQVSVVPADRQLRFLTRGEVVETRRPWKGQYQPVLDQVIAELARVYRERLGVIVFSGMCNDGEIGCRVAKACGAVVWVQSPESCMSADMPNAALKTGSVSFQGTPVELAQALVAHTASELA